MTGSASPRRFEALKPLLIPSLLYLAIFCVWSVVSMARWPIVAYDTDLWYHLTSGRYLFEHHTIPHDSFFSFLSPPREWVDYFWLFQAIVYLFYSWAQYDGLILLRVAIYLATLTLLVRFLFKAQQDQPSPPWTVFVIVTVSLILLQRAVALRPHLFTYLFILVFLYVFEYHPRRLMFLPALAVLWCNLHGIAYPIMLLIGYAYGLEELWTRLKGQAVKKRQGEPFTPTPTPLVQGVMVTAALSTAAALVTPHGLRLLRMPFISTAVASQYIRELTPLTFCDAFSFHIPVMTPSAPTLANVHLMVVCVALLLALLKRPLRISHVILALGGFILLAKGVRFNSEFALLTLPLLKTNPLFPVAGLTKQFPKPAYLIGMGLLMLLPLRLLVSEFSGRPAYPISSDGLPQGVAAFLNRVDVGGRILNHPDRGGYLQWRLYSRYAIFMDMEVPFLFTDEDMYRAVNVFSNEETLRETLSTYHPEFISVPNTTKDFPRLIQKFPDYVMVFFDDAEVLYLNQRRESSLAERYRLTGIDPFKLVDQGIEPSLKEARDREALLPQVRRLLEVYPDGQTANELVALVYNEDGSYDRALPFAEALLKNFPESPIGYRLKGDALKGLGAFPQAIAAYRAALERSRLTHQPDMSKDISKRIGLAYLGQQQFEKAFQALQAGIDVFSAETTPDDLFTLGSSARLAGRARTAEAVLKYLEHKIPKNDPSWAEKVERELAQLRAGRSTNR